MFEKVEVTTKEKLDELYKSCALTFTGIIADEENLNKIIEWIKNYSEISEPLQIHIIKGQVMNQNYGLTGNNAYKNELTLVSIKTEDIKNVNAVAIPRLEIGGRWFNDIVDNNSIREKRKQKSKPKCALIGQDGNIFSLVGIASRTLKRNGMSEQSKEMSDRVFSSNSYDEALNIIGEYVEIIAEGTLEDEEDEEY